jgi:hypothetical protein
MTNNKEQTAVDVSELAFELYPFGISERNAFINGYNKAKEMEKERIVKAWMDGVTGDSGHSTAIGYYNETYGGNK